MEKQTELTAEDLTKIWSKACDWQLDIQNYRSSGTDEYPIITINLSTSLSIVAAKESIFVKETNIIEDKYFVRLVFDNFLTYKKFELFPEQFEAMVILFENSISEKEKKQKEDLIKKGEFELNLIIQTINKDSVLNTNNINSWGNQSFSTPVDSIFTEAKNIT